MAFEEEKETEQEPAEQDLAGQEPEAQETGEEEKKRNYWWLSLGLMLCLLAGGGYYALSGMRQAAHKLAGGENYDQFSANSSVYEDGSAAVKNKDYFPLDEDAARAQSAAGAAGGRINSSLVRTRQELVADASGAQAAPAAAVQDAEETPSAGNAAPPAARGTMVEKMQARAFLSGGPGKSASSKGSSPGVTVAPFQGGGASVGKASEQRETRGAPPKQAGRGSVMDSLKGAFKATFYGARNASHDSARGWVAKAFDGSAEATTAIEYDENMRAKLDKINPDSIPKFLRDQDVSAAEAKRLEISDVGAPKMDKEGTKEALAEDKAYQAKKLASDFSSSMINGLFAGISGTGSPGGDDRAGPGAPEDPEGFALFADSEDGQSLLDQELQDYIELNGFGEECGCTMEAACCCLGGGGGEDGGAGADSGLWAGPDSGDFPSGGDGSMWA
ncbi:MAG: hypothetical protein Q7R35_01960 [Elusimicrobiota bacterium]|nr:hypothetical protein [Elusimicrobiota bacterium]